MKSAKDNTFKYAFLFAIWGMALIGHKVRRIHISLLIFLSTSSRTLFLLLFCREAGQDKPKRGGGQTNGWVFYKGSFIIADLQEDMTNQRQGILQGTLICCCFAGGQDKPKTSYSTKETYVLLFCRGTGQTKAQIFYKGHLSVAGCRGTGQTKAQIFYKGHLFVAILLLFCYFAGGQDKPKTRYSTRDTFCHCFTCRAGQSKDQVFYN